jgi:hypothetical protein
MVAGVASMSIAKTDNMHLMWAPLIFAGLGIGGIIVPASIITTIVCPDDLIATVAALTLTIRVIGGSIGYTTYYNVFKHKFTAHAKARMIPICIFFNITSPAIIGDIISLTGNSLLDDIKDLPGVDGNETKWLALVKAGQLAYADSYKYVYYTSIAFGGIAILASLFLGNIEDYMDDHIAVVIH